MILVTIVAGALSSTASLVVSKRGKPGRKAARSPRRPAVPDGGKGSPGD